MNNPKIDAVLDFFGLENIKCDLIKIEYEIGSVRMFMYDFDESKCESTVPKVEELTLQDYCNIIGYVADIELAISKETFDTLFDFGQHRKIISSTLALPSGYLQFQYEDETENTDVSMYMEHILRDSFRVV